MKRKRVLVYGEFSGYGKSLREGFLELGCDADVFSFNGDGWKSINSNLQLSGKNKFYKFFDFIRLIPTFFNYDLILIMNPRFVSMRFLGPFMLLFWRIFNKKIALLCCGDDSEYIRRGKDGSLKRWLYDGVSFPKKNYYSSFWDVFVHKCVANAAHVIIPTMSDYAMAWELSAFRHKVSDVIPLACDGLVAEIKKTDINSIKIMHGINRPDVKGTAIIKKALDVVKSEFGEKIEIFYPEKLPFTEYLALMKSIDISIDQTKCSSYGMNAIYSMYAGHVVVTPADDDCLRYFNIKRSPLISIENDEINIASVIRNLIKNASSLDRIKIETQQYAIKMHSPQNIAAKILKLLIE